MSRGASTEPSERFDLIIRGGKVVDGTGAPAFVGDVGVRDGHIAAIARGSRLRGAAAEEIDAAGKLVCPGWIDVHTHIDGQITWDPSLAPLATNGVTTAVMGNCGVGFAPCEAPRRKFLMELMEGVEDIPLGALDAGVKWEWETFPEFLDALAKKELACDVAAMVGHGPVRAYVLGDRANLSDRTGGNHENPITKEDADRIAGVVEEAIAAGAIGFSTSRTLLHRDKRGVLVPGTCAMEHELLAIGRGVARGGGGIFELATDFMCFDDVRHTPENHKRRLQHFGREWIWMKQISKGYGVPVCFCMGMPSATPVEDASGYRSMLRMLDEANDDGCSMACQVFVRPQCVLMTWRSLSHPFAECPTFLRTVRRNKAADKAALRDPAVRAAVCAEAAALAQGGGEGNFGISLPKSSLGSEEGEEETAGNLNCTADGEGALTRMFLNNARFIFHWSADGEPDNDTSAEATAQREGRPVAEVLYDWLCEEDCEQVLTHYFMNYAKRTLDDTQEMLTHPRTVPGLGDAGAHLGFLSDAGSHTYLLSHWVRDSGRMGLEAAVKLHTHDTAELFGMADRGTLAVGKRADVNVIDLAALRVLRPSFVRDLPTGAARWVQFAKGYSHTLCRGVVTHRDGEATGAYPGGLVRNPFAARRRAAARYDTVAGRGAMAASTAKWEAAYWFIFKALLPLLGAARFEKLGRMQDAKPLPPPGPKRGALVPVLMLVAAVVVARYLAALA